MPDIASKLGLKNNRYYPLCYPNIIPKNLISDIYYP
jgi:hypothetical protein